jgi:hypothetical protein
MMFYPKYKNMKTLILLLVALIPCLVFGQSIERKFIGSGGTNTVSATGMQVSQSIGECMVKSYPTSTLIVSSGYQQGSSTSVGTAESLDNDATFAVYPNPVGDLLNVRIESEKALQLEFSFHDIQGKMTPIPTSKVAVQGSTTETVDFSQVASGTYLLTIRDLKTGAVKTVQVRKVD